MATHKDIKINARGLSNPGPRMMVESAISEGEFETMRVVVSSKDALKDLQSYFSSIGATFEADQIGDDYHIFVDLTSQEKS